MCVNQGLVNNRVWMGKMKVQVDAVELGVGSCHE